MDASQNRAHWEVNWSLDKQNSAYRIGESIVVACTFKNIGQTPLHLRRIGIQFDWEPANEWYYTSSNIIYQPNQWFWPVSYIPIAVPFDVSLGYHDYKIGIDFRSWEGHQWLDSGVIRWVEPTSPSLDQVLIDYPQPRNFTVFVSHSEKDAELTRVVADFIRRSGQVPYLAESSQNPDLGKRLWQDKIDRALQSANAILLLWTHNAAESPAVTYEIQRTLQLNKRLIPVVEDGATLPAEIQNRVYARFNYHNPNDAVKSILTSLLDYETEVNRQQGNSIGGIIALIAGLGIVGAILSDR